MADRMIIPVNFDNEDDYEYVKNMPNRSHYIRELVKKDRKNQKNNDFDQKIQEIKRYIDEKLSGVNVVVEDEYVDKLEGFINAFDN